MKPRSSQSSMMGRARRKPYSLGDPAEHAKHPEGWLPQTTRKPGCNDRISLMNEQMYAQAADLSKAEFGDELVASGPKRGECFGMGDVSARVWRLLAEPNDLDSMCASLTAQYNVEAAQCRTEVGQLLDEMVAAGLVERV